MRAADATPAETLAAVLAGLVAGSRAVAVGTASPIPAAAALLARHLAPAPMVVSILGSNRLSPFTDGGVELFDFAAQGRLDSFFLGGGQIDGEGNVNLVGIGPYPAATVRLPGSYGSAYLAALVPNVVLFREEHSPRVLVPRVDFVSAAGHGPAGTFRPGGPTHLLTGRALFRFDPGRRRFVLLSCHAGECADTVRARTGFDFDAPDRVPETPPPTPAALALLRGPVAGALEHLYPRFVATALGSGGDTPALAPAAPITVRPAGAADHDALWSCLEPVLRAGETYALPRDWDRDQALEYWLMPQHAVFVAERAGRVVGTYYLQANQRGGGAHVANCGYVTHAEAAGQGVARAMAAHSFAEAVRRGFGAMQFNFVVATNQRAVALWRSLGFAVAGTLPGAFDHPRLGKVDALVMFRRL